MYGINPRIPDSNTADSTNSDHFGIAGHMLARTPGIVAKISVPTRVNSEPISVFIGSVTADFFISSLRLGGWLMSPFCSLASIVF